MKLQKVAGISRDFSKNFCTFQKILVSLQCMRVVGVAFLKVSKVCTPFLYPHAYI